jgi:hypothetical protein
MVIRWRLTWALAGLAGLAATLGPSVPAPAALIEATIPARLGDIAFAVGEQFYVVTSDVVEPAGPRSRAAVDVAGRHARRQHRARGHGASSNPTATRSTHDGFRRSFLWTSVGSGASPSW